MVFWAIIWFIMLITVIIFTLQENINGTIELRFWVTVVLVICLIAIPVLTISVYNQSKVFCENYTKFYNSTKNLTEAQEYSIIGKVMNYNYDLYLRQSSARRWGILSPVSPELKKLTPIELKYFNMSECRWWE